MKKTVLVCLIIGALLTGSVLAGLITKPQTFTGSTTPQLPWLDSDFDTLYSEINGNLDDANIKSGANIAQSKILNLVTDLAAKFDLTGGTISGNLIIRNTNPYFTLRNSSGGSTAPDWQVNAPVSSPNDLIFYENGGTEGTPSYVERARITGAGVITDAMLTTTLTTKSYVDAKTSGLSIGVSSSTTNFSTSSNTLVDVTGMVQTIPFATNQNHRARINFFGSCQADGPAIMNVAPEIDGSAANIIAMSTSGGGLNMNCSFSFVTAALVGGYHTFKLKAAVSNGVAMTILGSTGYQFAVEELGH